MPLGVIETPRTEMGDQTRLTNGVDMDFTTEQSIPSPSNEGGDLIKQIRGMRHPAMRTPKHRAPFTDRQNLPARPEFTPLLKSATRNSLIQSSGGYRGKENSHLQTPAALKASYNGGSSPALPLNSSVIIEEHTGSSAGNGEISIMGPAATSSSALSTPLALRPNGAQGPLDHGGVATLKEQEAKLEQIDKENFGLKLKIHFLEEALRKSGKDFNETALRENTELKVDKVTLQRDLKHYRKLLAQAQQDIEDYKRQLYEYAERLKNNQSDPRLASELEELRRALEDRDAEIARLLEKLREAESGQSNLRDLKDEIEDLQMELRNKEGQLDEKDDQIDSLKRQHSEEGDLEQELQELKDALAERDEDLKGYQDAIRRAAVETEKKLGEKDRQLEIKDDELKDLEEQLQRKETDQSGASNQSQAELERRDREIEALHKRLAAAEDAAAEVESLKEELSLAQSSLSAEQRAKARALEEKDFEIHSLERRLDAQDDDETRGDEQLRGQIDDLEFDLRQKQNALDEAQDQLEELKTKLAQTEAAADDELLEAQDRIQELETQEERRLKELQSLRTDNEQSSDSRSKALELAQTRIRELQDQKDVVAEQEQLLRNELSGFRLRCSELEQKQVQTQSLLSSERDEASRQKRILEDEKASKESQLIHMRHTIETLQKVEGNLSGRESQLQRALDEQISRLATVEADGRQCLDEARDETRRQRQALDGTKLELSQVRMQLQIRDSALAEAQDKIQGLEDEIELLDSGAMDDAQVLRDDMDAARQEATSLRRQMQGLQQDLARTQTQLREAERQLELARDTTKPITNPPTPTNRRIDDLEKQLSRLTLDRNDLQDRLHGEETAHAETKAGYNTLRIDMQSSGSSRDQLEQRINELLSQLSSIRKERQNLQDSLASKDAQYSKLRSNYDSAESDRSASDKVCAELRAKLQSMQREADQKLQAELASYERDVQNLEQDLADALASQESLLKKNEVAERTISQLKSKTRQLEADLTTYHSKGANDANAAFDERADLHEMLKDAKLEAEDLQFQVSERDQRLKAAASKESELREQLKRVRGERASQAALADEATRTLHQLQSKLDVATVELEDLRLQQRSVRFPRGSLTASTTAPTDATAVEKRHAAELRGLARQIEYLGARCRREETFRADLAFVKTYFTRVAEMHAQCTDVDLRLVAALGIPADAVLADEHAKLRAAGPGRVALRGVDRQTGLRRSRPSLKVVALSVLAGVRMQRAADKWAVVRKNHEGLLKKLGAMRKDRKEVAAKKDVSAAGRKRTLGER